MSDITSQGQNSGELQPHCLLWIYYTKEWWPFLLFHLPIHHQRRKVNCDCTLGGKGLNWTTCLPHFFTNKIKRCCCCSVAKSCLTLCDLVDCSIPRFPILHYLPEFAQTHVHWTGDAIQLSVVPVSSCRQSFPTSVSFPIGQFCSPCCSGYCVYWSMEGRAG